MGKKVTVTLFDDLEPELAAEVEREFSIAGVDYHLDLSEKNARVFDKDFDKWTEVAAKVSGRSASGRKRTGRAPGPSGGESGLPLAEIRAWAKENNMDVAEKGRVSAEVVRAWRAAQDGDEPVTPAKKAPAKKAAPAPATSQS